MRENYNISGTLFKKVKRCYRMLVSSMYVHDRGITIVGRVYKLKYYHLVLKWCMSGLFVDVQSKQKEDNLQ